VICPVDGRCSMHSLARAWLDGEPPNTTRLVENFDIFVVLSRRVWRGCTCELFPRICEVTGLKPVAWARQRAR
jgi:hypothetical protein